MFYNHSSSGKGTECVSSSLLLQKFSKNMGVILILNDEQHIPQNG